MVSCGLRSSRLTFLQRSRITKCRSNVVRDLILWRKVDFLKELWGDGETSSCAESAESGVLIVMVVVQVVASTCTIDGATASVILFYIGCVVVRRHRGSVVDGSVALLLRQFDGKYVAGWSSGRGTNTGSRSRTRAREATQQQGSNDAVGQSMYSTRWDSSKTRQLISSRWEGMIP